MLLSLLFVIIIFLFFTIILPLFVLCFLTISNKLLQTKLKKGNSVFEASFKFAYQANFVVWFGIFILVNYTGIKDVQFSCFQGLYVFLIIYVIGTFVTTFTTGLVLGTIAKANLKIKKEIKSIITPEEDHEQIEKNEEKSALLDKKHSGVSCIEKEGERSNYNEIQYIKDFVASKNGKYIGIILSVVYGLIYHFSFKNLQGYDFIYVVLTVVIPSLIAVLPVLLNQKEFLRRASLQIFFPFFSNLIFIMFAIKKDDEIIALFLFGFPYFILVSIASVVLCIIRKKINKIIYSR